MEAFSFNYEDAVLLFVKKITLNKEVLVKLTWQ